MKSKLTPKTIEHLKAEGRRRLEIWDTVLLGFGIRVYSTGRKVWFVIARVKGRQRRFTIEKVLNHRTGVISGVAAVYNRYGYADEKRDALERWAQWVIATSGVQKSLAKVPTSLLAS